MGAALAASPYDLMNKQAQARQAASQLQTQHADQGMAADQSGFARTQGSLDASAHTGDFVNFLDTLNNKGYVDKAGSSSETSMTGGGSGNPNGTVGVSTWTPTMPGSGGTMSSPAAVNLGSPVASDAVAFAKAKDRVGASTQGLMKALANQFSARNLSGGSAEVAATGNTLLGAAGQLSDVARDEAIKESNDSNDFAKTAYQGGITQRGQDLSELASSRAANLSARGQDIGLEDSRESRANALTLQRRSQNSPASLVGLYNAFNSQPRY